ncbi:hypothetical protein [Streptosporangium saharense]|uniref:hypothetical protein n=1 Tax=Streptosporangium saharense TaxID=1706840 RepID=UPI00343BBEE8
MHLTEQHHIPDSVVYGYLRLVKASEARQDALSQALAEYCRQHELLLAGVFTEREPTRVHRSPAFTGLLNVLAVPGVYGVVLPTLSHLGPRANARQRQRKITGLGTRLLLIRDTARPHRLGERTACFGDLLRRRSRELVIVSDAET